MKNRKKPLFFSLSILLIAALMTACSSNNTPASSGAASASSSANTGSNANKEPITLTVWGVPSLTTINDTTKTPEEIANSQSVYDFIQSEMEKKFPGIKIDYVDKGWGDDLRQNLMISVMAGNPPDVSWGEDFIPEFARLNALSEVPSDIAKDLAEGPMAAAKLDGKDYAVSGMTGIFSLMYNKDVMTKAGLDPNTPPKTWSEWIDMSNKITAAGKGEYFGSVVQTAGLGGAFRIVPFMRQLGGDLTASDGSTITFDTPENAKALEFLKELSKSTPTGSTALNDEGALYNMVHHGKAAFGVAGPWHITWAATEKCNCGYAPLPVPDEGGKRANVIVGNTLWFALKQSKHQEEAMEFLRIIASEQYQEKFALISSRMPSNKLAAANPELIKAVPDLAVFGEIVANEEAGPLPVFTKNGPKVWEAWYKAQEGILIADKPIAASLAEAQKTAEGLLK
ncbi:extracellular solute-binding protein [Cohnella sp. GCM10012308]|uniref:extracellular solute-binding protein n=1 Tax=Cohnella sp. GCM10012308 TaxID=3317329 RepID=UPI00360940B5